MPTYVEYSKFSMRPVLVLLLISAWVFGIACGTGLPTADTAAVSTKPVETTTLLGAPLTIPAIGKITIVVFLSPHCASCKKLVADLDRYRRRFDPHRIAVIGIVLDADRNAAVQLKSKEQVDFPWTVGHAERFATAFRVRGVPSAFLISQQGEISLTADGSSGDAERILRGIHALLEP